MHYIVSETIHFFQLLKINKWETLKFSKQIGFVGWRVVLKMLFALHIFFVLLRRWSNILTVLGIYK